MSLTTGCLMSGAQERLLISLDRPARWLASKTSIFYLALVLCGATALAFFAINRSPFGFMLRATRDSPIRAETLGINRISVQWAAFVIASSFAGIAGGAFAFS